MNIDNDEMEPATDLGLRLGYSSEFIQRRLNIESGAGVNAGLRINIPFVASSPLSELVWSPHKGLGIKCAESSFMDSRPSLLLGVGQSNVLLPQIAISTDIDKPMDEATMHVSEGNCLSKLCPMPVAESSHERGTGGYGEGANTVQVSLQLLHTNQEEHHLQDGEGKGLCGPVDAQTEELSNTKEEKTSSILDLLSTNCGFGCKEDRSDEVKAKILPIEPSFGSTSGGIDGSGYETIRREIVLTSQACPMNECEASSFRTADLISVGEKWRAEQPSMVAEESKSKIKKTGLESTDENDLIGKNEAIKESTREVENDFQKDEEALKIVSAKHSPISSKVGRCRRRGKEKALSDEDDDSSHGSVESCNSAGLFPTGKKRWSFEQLLMHSKRAKKEIQDSTSCVSKDSSFMNWISNMVKGFGKLVEDKEPQNLVSLEKTQDAASLNMGFQSIFKSLYCSSTVADDSRDYAKISNIDATPIAYHRESGTSCKQFTPSNEKLNESISKTESAKPKVLPVNSDSIQEHCNTSSAENINSKALVLGKENSSTENNNSDLPSQGKTTHVLSYRSDPLGSLWINRFSPKTPGPLSHVVHHNLSAVCTKPDSHHQSNPLNHSTEEPLTSPDRELQNTTNAEVSSGAERVSGHDDDNLCKLDSNSSSQRFRSSEAMASVFARRLDALKHIVSSGVTDDAARAATNCFFCGMRGHQLRECPEIAETELDDLLRNINLPGGAEESSCLCIRCFQLNHWAISCPNSLREPREVDHAASLPSKLQHKRTTELLDSKESGVEFEHNLKHKLNERMISGSTVVNRCVASSSMKDESKEEQIGVLNRQMPEMPMGMFDAIKRLRLCRTDILKWKNSHISLSRLNGFFLRLRLGKWEQGLGGSGYYVACIDGSEWESSSPNSRDVIPVNVGCIKCLVESQYISNHDFRDDELMAWWSATMRNGGEIPSIEDLRDKIKEKSNLQSCPPGP